MKQSIAFDGTFSDVPKVFRGIRGAIWIAVLVIAALAPTLGNGFVYDDFIAIADNEMVTEAQWGKPWHADIWGNTGLPNCGTYRPLLVTSFIVQWQLSGGNPAVFIVVNLLLHLCVAVMVFRLVRRWLPPPLPWFVAVLFALHPANSEVTHNIVQHSTLLSAFFSILYLFVLLPKNGEAPSVKRHVAGAFLFLAAILSKESGLLALPLLLVIERYAPGGEESWKATLYRQKLAAIFGVVVVAVAFALRSNALGSVASDIPEMYNPTLMLPLPLRHLNMGWLFTYYLWRFVWPFPQPMDWLFNQLPMLDADSLNTLLMVWIFLGALGYVVVKKLHSRSPALLGMLWFVVQIVLVTQAFATVTNFFSERNLYLAGIGLCITSVWLVFRFLGNNRWGWRPPALLLAGILVIFLGYQAKIAKIWADDLTLFENYVAHSPNSANAQLGYGKQLFGHKLYDQAAPHFRRAVMIYPKYLQAYHWLGRSYFAMGAYGSAITIWRSMKTTRMEEEYPLFWQTYANWTTDEAERLIGLYPNRSLGLYSACLGFDDSRYPCWAGRAYAAAIVGHPKEEFAIDQWLSHFPDDPRNAKTLGMIAQHHEKWDRALEWFHEALKYAPEDTTLHLAVGHVLAQTGRTQEALKKLEQLAAKHPDDVRIPSLIRSIQTPEAAN